MTSQVTSSDQIKVYPATAARWPDLETLFGRHGASEDCWCMFWRLRRKEFTQLSGEARKSLLKENTLENQVPGVLAYVNGKVAGWCSIAPRAEYKALATSRRFKPIDNEPVWSIVCFYVSRAYRFRGVMQALIGGAVEYALEQGAKIIEGYPVDLQSPRLSGHKLTGDGGYMGVASIFRRAGFIEVGRASETQLIMRYVVG